MTSSTAAFVSAPGLAELVATQGEEVEFPRGDVIFTQGTGEDDVYFIRSGKVKIGLESPDGGKNLLAIYGPSDVLGEVPLFDEGPPASFAIAVTDVQAVSVRHEALRGQICARPELAEYMLRLLARRLRQTNSLRTDLALTDVPGRVANVLLQLAAQFGHREGDALRVVHDMTHKELAQFIGATRESVTKVLSRFTKRGWLRVEPGSVLIFAPHRLARRGRQLTGASRTTSGQRRVPAGTAEPDRGAHRRLSPTTTC